MHQSSKVSKLTKDPIQTSGKPPDGEDEEDEDLSVSHRASSPLSQLT